MRLALVCFYCLCVFVYVLYFIATMSFAGYFLSVLFCMLSMLISDSRFDLVWFRLSCDHGWIRSGSVNVRKQQQQQQQRLKLSWSTVVIRIYLPLHVHLKSPGQDIELSPSIIRCLLYVTFHHNKNKFAVRKYYPVLLYEPVTSLNGYIMCGRIYLAL